MSLSIQRIEFAEPVKRRLVERLRESVERIREAERTVDKIEVRIKASKSEENRQILRKQIREQRDGLRGISDDFDAPTDELKRELRTVVEGEIRAEQAKKELVEANLRLVVSKERVDAVLRDPRHPHAVVGVGQGARGRAACVVVDQAGARLRPGPRRRRSSREGVAGWTARVRGAEGARPGASFQVVGVVQATARRRPPVAIAVRLRAPGPGSEAEVRLIVRTGASRRAPSRSPGSGRRSPQPRAEPTSPPWNGPDEAWRRQFHLGRWAFAAVGTLPRHARSIRACSTW